MYVTADGAEETVLAAPSEYGIGGPTSVSSEDVEKAGTVITNTPDGRMRLTDYLTNVEKEIAAEEAARKRDVQAVRAQMARNFAFNKNARAKLEAALLHKMAVNAKKAKDDLHAAMTFVQGKFHAAADLQNKRWHANEKRSKHLRKTIADNKHEAKQNLEKAVLTQQRAMATLASKTNARIKSTDEHVATNAAQIKSDAEKARKDLEKSVAEFDQKVANARADAKKGRGELAAQLASQNKATRQWANNKLKEVMAATAAQFRRVRAKMAEDREHADNALKTASTTMTASLNANKALQDKRFATTVKDIKAAKAEAKRRVDKAQTNFKSSLNTLRSTIHDQVTKTQARIDQLTLTVQKHKLAQAKVNANVNAETKRMIKLGDKRYNEHLKKDKELENLIKANKEATDKRIKAMATHYMQELDAVRATMKKNRAHATHALAKETGKLYSKIAKAEQAQLEENNKLKKQTKHAKFLIKRELDDAKTEFAKKLGALHTTVTNNDKKFEGKLNKLTGIVSANALKSKNGRKDLKNMMDANKKELDGAVRDAIHKGETRMAAAETKLMNLSKKTKASLNVKITAEISKLTKRANSQIEGLRLQSKEARKEMKKELLMAIRSMADEAKENLDSAVEVMTAAFKKQNTAEEEAAKLSLKERKALAGQIKVNAENAKQELEDAVAGMQKTLLALKTETHKKIKKTNKRIDAYGEQIEKEASDVKNLMGAQLKTLTAKIDAQKAAAKKATDAADAKSVAAFEAISNKVEKTLEDAAKKSNKKFKTLYDDMAKQRKALDDGLASSVMDINDSIAKQAALADSRFSKTVKDIEAARAQAAKQVKDARKDFATKLDGLTASVKAMETKLLGDVEVVSGEVISHKATQRRVNKKTQKEIKRITDLMNDQHSKSKKARGKLRTILDENKRAAAEEVKSLQTLFEGKIAKIRSTAAADARGAKKDLTAASKKMYEALADAQNENNYRNQVSANKIGSYSKESLAAIAKARKAFGEEITTLTNVVAANHAKVERQTMVLTGVIRDYKAAGKKDRALIREQNDTLNTNMLKDIRTAIQIGEARAKRVADEARQNLAGAKKALLLEITNRVEEEADKIFKTIQGKHGKVADNYLSLKAYAITAADKVNDYVGKGKGKNLSSLGDLLTNIAGLSDVKVSKAEGISPSSSLKTPFSGDKVKIKNSVSKINGLVNEYVKVANGVRDRWPSGLGKYLLFKLNASMSRKGCLQVDKIDDKNGNWVFMNGHAVGLSNKLNDFESLAVRMAHYESTLAKLTANLSGKHIKPEHQLEYAKAPEWQGN
jgi:hypothetical protein